MVYQRRVEALADQRAREPAQRDGRDEQRARADQRQREGEDLRRAVVPDRWPGRRIRPARAAPPAARRRRSPPGRSAATATAGARRAGDDGRARARSATRRRTAARQSNRRREGAQPRGGREDPAIIASGMRLCGTMRRTSRRHRRYCAESARVGSPRSGGGRIGCLSCDVHLQVPRRARLVGVRGDDHPHAAKCGAGAAVRDRSRSTTSRSKRRRSAADVGQVVVVELAGDDARARCRRGLGAAAAAAACSEPSGSGCTPVRWSISGVASRSRGPPSTVPSVSRNSTGALFAALRDDHRCGDVDGLLEGLLGVEARAAGRTARRCTAARCRRCA